MPVCGGPDGWVQVLGSEGELLGLSLRPEDPFANKILSDAVVSENVVLQVTVPRRTGRRRKRGSSGPFLAPVDEQATEDASQQPAAPSASKPVASDRLAGRTWVLRRSLRDNPTSYTVKPIGFIQETHRFRGATQLRWRSMLSDADLPDFQYYSSAARVKRCITDCLIPCTCT